MVRTKRVTVMNLEEICSVKVMLGDSRKAFDLIEGRWRLS